MMLRVFYFMRKREKHGLSYSNEYGIWSDIKKRCLNKKYSEFHYYGGRGITVCDEWKESFLSFYRDMGPRPSKDHSIDRIDVNGNYCKENCRWATNIEQARNTRIQKNNSTGFRGVSFEKSKNRFRAYISVNSKRKFLGTFKTIEQAIEERKKAELKYWTI